MISNRTSRRAFMAQGALCLLAPGFLGNRALAGADARRVRVGLMTDLHYADKRPSGSRHYRETLDKLAEAAERYQADRPDLMVELGDLIDAADSVASEKVHLARVWQQFSALPGEKHYVLGNHCVDHLNKQEFLEGVEQARAHYSFDREGWHFVVLDACYRADGVPYGRRNFHWTDPNIPPEQVEWLRGDLQEGDSPTIVFAHQRLDVADNYAVKNAGQVRKVLEESERVRAVFQGHSHRNELREIGGIHYCTLRAMVEGSGPENNGYAVMDLHADGTIRIAGFREQHGYEWGPGAD